MPLKKDPWLIACGRFRPIAFALMLVGTVIVVIGFLAGGLGLRMMVLMTAPCSRSFGRGQGL